MSDAPKPKRRLPVIGAAPLETDIERPRWQLAGISAVAMLIAWIVFASLTNVALGSRAAVTGADVLVTGVHSLAFFVSASLAGALAHRVGGAKARSAATLGAVLAAALGWSVPFAWWLTSGGRAFGLWLALLAAMAFFAMLGARTGFSIAARATRA